MRVLIPYARSLGNGRMLVQTDDQPFVQKFIGDLIAKFKDTETIEVKAEKANKYGTLFLESWSNRAYFTHGWMHTSRASLLWYYFVESDELYTVSLDELKRWAFAHDTERSGHSNISRYPERLQSKYVQTNDTWGWSVPICDLQKYVNGFEGPVSPIGVMRKKAS